MKARYNGKIVDVWEIGRDTEQPEWVQDAFTKKYICWIDNHVRILMAGLKPSLRTNFKIGATGTAGGALRKMPAHHYGAIFGDKAPTGLVYASRLMN
ncbi:hypothetical protein [Streptococcus sp. sy004]|uniref:hypothetical protein n=1 Tax=Streptococcus sp. sy004 TaxID=2600149 RepID=UPI0021BD3D36|nr:hypothetical protein [Streptococcus sp. sy004]